MEIKMSLVQADRDKLPETIKNSNFLFMNRFTVCAFFALPILKKDFTSI